LWLNTSARRTSGSDAINGETDPQLLARIDRLRRLHGGSRLRQTLFNSEASLRHASVLSRSSGEIRGSDDVPDHRKFLIQKVLRFWQKGRSSSPRLARISSDFLFGNSLAVKGGALIHGPCLVARSVGSEWRTRLPYQIDIQFNQLREKQCIVI